MKSTSINTIVAHAKKANTSSQKWHFHILSPECDLNTKKQFALVFENTDTQETLVHYSANPLMSTGKQLVQLLHGQDVIPTQKQALTQPSAFIQPILAKASELSKKRQFWHHHLFFPACQFNPHLGQWTICLEDQESGEVLESVYAKEPKSDLKHLEALFYAQKKP